MRGSVKSIIIDGHNLIPKLPGMSLSDPDDESKLTQLLGEYCRLKRVKAELFFDAAPPGSVSQSRYGMVNVHHVSKRTTADAAIRQFLQEAGRQAKNFQVVTSDHQVQAEARGVNASVVSSDEFALALLNVIQMSPSSTNTPEKYPAEDEVDYWLKVMTERNHKGDLSS